MNKKLTLKNKSIYSVQLLSTFPTVPNTVIRAGKELGMSEAEYAAYTKCIKNYGDEMLEVVEGPSKEEDSGDETNTDGESEGTDLDTDLDEDSDDETSTEDDSEGKSEDETTDDQQLRDDAYHAKLLNEKRKLRLTYLKEEYNKETDKNKKKILAEEIKKIIREIKGSK